jgi:hypothetical protein
MDRPVANLPNLVLEDNTLLLGRVRPIPAVYLMVFWGLHLGTAEEGDFDYHYYK